MNKKKILWISLCAPYDAVVHAGGKIHNRTVKALQNSQKFEIFLISFCREYEVPLLDLDQYHIKNNIITISGHPVKQVLKKIINIGSTLNPFHKYAGIVPNFQKHYALKAAQDYLIKGEQPDIIILDWTQIVVLYPQLVKWFPTSKFVMIEVDVAFLGYKRKIDIASNSFQKRFMKLRYEKLKKIELNALLHSDLVIVNNHKDKKLLLHNNLPEDKLFVLDPFYTDYSRIQWNQTTNNILFLGSMERSENYKSVIWFIENVFSKIENPEVKLVILGGNPHHSLEKYRSSRIQLTGFVPDVSTYFSTCMCFIAPLIMGAGIKIKVIEALSAGIPVLTNEIGIEGIPAIKEQDYFHCETAEDYLNIIDCLTKQKINVSKLSENAKKVIKDNFNYSEKITHMIDRIYEC